MGKEETALMSITNENFKLMAYGENVNSKALLRDDTNKKLQSPVESHFALTPTTNSESSSPKNGFTSIEGTNLLQEELDQLAFNEEKIHTEINQTISSGKSSLFADGFQSPTDENISMFVRIENDLMKSNENLDVIAESTSNEKTDNNAEVSISIFPLRH